MNSSIYESINLMRQLTNELMDLAKNNSQDLDRMRDLIAKGAKVNFIDSEEPLTPLGYAIENNNLAMCQLLLDNGADVNFEPLNGSRFRFIQLAKDKPAILDLLQKYGAKEIIIAKPTPTKWPSREEQMSQHDRVVEKIYHVDEETFEEAKVALADFHLFLNKKAGEDIVLFNNGKTVRKFRSDALFTEGKTMLQLLGSRVKLFDWRLGTPERYTEQDRRILVKKYSYVMYFLKLFSEYGPTHFIEEDEDCTALRWAITHGYVEVVSALVRAGADVHKRDRNGNTPLHLAAQQCNTKIVRILVVAGGADVGAVNNEDYTPLHYAGLKGHKKIVRFLTKFI